MISFWTIFLEAKKNVLFLCFLYFSGKYRPNDEDKIDPKPFLTVRNFSEAVDKIISTSSWHEEIYLYKSTIELKDHSYVNCKNWHIISIYMLFICMFDLFTTWRRGLTCSSSPELWSLYMYLCTLRAAYYLARQWGCLHEQGNSRSF